MLHFTTSIKHMSDTDKESLQTLEAALIHPVCLCVVCLCDAGRGPTEPLDESRSVDRLIYGLASRLVHQLYLLPVLMLVVVVVVSLSRRLLLAELVYRNICRSEI